MGIFDNRRARMLGGREVESRRYAFWNCENDGFVGWCSRGVIYSVVSPTVTALTFSATSATTSLAVSTAEVTTDSSDFLPLVAGAASSASSFSMSFLALATFWDS